MFFKHAMCCYAAALLLHEQLHNPDVWNTLDGPMPHEVFDFHMAVRDTLNQVASILYPPRVA